MNSEQLESFLASATPYHFTITNKCDNLQKVVINLESLIADGKQLNDEYINAILYETDYNNNLFKNKKLNEEVLNDENKVIKDARHAYKLYSFNLKNNEEKEFNLQLYLDEETPLNEDTINASWKGKITLSGEYKENTQKALPAIEYLKNVEKEESGKPSPQLIYDETEDRNLRYIGESPDNYISFNNEIWRIVGVTKVTTIDGTKEERLKIIRQSGIEGQEDIGEFSYTNTYVSMRITEKLNGIYYDDNKYIESYGIINKNARISSEDARGMIDKEIEWLNPKIMDNNSITTDTPLITYQNEQNNEYEKWSIKNDYLYNNGVGTLTKSDYGLAIGKSIRENCLNVKMNVFDTNNCSTDNWLIPKDYNQNLYDGGIGTDGKIYSYAENYSIWPVVYIKKNVKITSGDGTLDSPFVLEREPVNRSEKTCKEDPNSYECFLLKNDEAYAETQLAFDGKEELGEELGTDDNNLRFVGAAPNNYVRFNDEIWRVIGVLSVKDDDGTMVRRLKIIRLDEIEGQKIFGLFGWNAKDFVDGGNWLTATLREMLNSSYFNSTTGECFTEWSIDPKTCDFTGNGEQPRGLNERARKMIDKDVRWGIGGSEEKTPKDFYVNERTVEWTKENDPEYHNGVGLIYISDYAYMAEKYYRAECLKRDMENYGSISSKDYYYKICGATTWFTGVNLQPEVFNISCLNRANFDYNRVFIISTSNIDFGLKNYRFATTLYYDPFNTMADALVYPTVYLEDNVHIIENPKPSEFYGTLENPFILEQVE